MQTFEERLAKEILDLNMPSLKEVTLKIRIAMSLSGYTQKGVDDSDIQLLKAEMKQLRTENSKLKRKNYKKEMRFQNRNQKAS